MLADNDCRQRNARSGLATAVKIGRKGVLAVCACGCGQARLQEEDEEEEKEAAEAEEGEEGAEEEEEAEAQPGAYAPQSHRRATT